MTAPMTQVHRASWLFKELRSSGYPCKPTGALGADVYGPGGVVFIEVRGDSVHFHGVMEIEWSENVLKTVQGALLMTVGVPKGH